MGRWAQASRTGGSKTALNFMRSAIDSDPVEIQVEYAQPIGASSFTPASFVTNPSAQAGTVIGQFDAHTITIQFPLDITADTTLVYSGTVPNILTPQTITH